MNGRKRTADLRSSLASVRSAIDEALREKRDPLKVLCQVGPALDGLGGEIGAMRDYAPGLGDVWDTCMALRRLADEMADWYSPSGEEESDAGVQPATPAVERVGDALPGEFDGYDAGDVPAQPDD